MGVAIPISDLGVEGLIHRQCPTVIVPCFCVDTLEMELQSEVVQARGEIGCPSG